MPFLEGQSEDVKVEGMGSSNALRLRTTPHVALEHDRAKRRTQLELPATDRQDLIQTQTEHQRESLSLMAKGVPGKGTRNSYPMRMETMDAAAARRQPKARAFYVEEGNPECGCELRVIDDEEAEQTGDD